MSPAFTGNNLVDRPLKWGKLIGAVLLFLASGYLVFALVGLYYIQPAMAATNFNPSSETLSGGTLGVSGAVSDLSSNNGAYRKLRGYASAYNAAYYTAASDGNLTLSSTSWVNAVNLNFTAPATASNFFILASGEYADTSATASRAAGVGLSINGGTSRVTEAYDSVTTVTCATSWVSTTIPYLKPTSASASETYRLMARLTSTTSTSGFIRNSRITAWDVGADAQSATPANSTTTSASYTNIASMTFTPDVTQDWLLFAHADMRGSTASSLNMWVNLRSDGTQQAEAIERSQSTSANVGEVPVFLMDKVSLSGGSSHTIDIQMKISSGTLTYTYVRLYAIPASKFGEVQYAENDTRQNMNGTGRINALNLNWTPNTQTDYMLLASGGEYVSAATTNSVLAFFVNGSTDMGASNFAAVAVDTTNIAPCPSWSVSKILNLAVSAQSLHIQFNGTVAATLVSITYPKIMAIKMSPAGQYTASAIYSGTSTATTLKSLNWQIDSSWSIPSVSVTLKLYNSNSSSWPSSGDGYQSYTSSSTANTDELKNQNITTNPTYYKNTAASGNWQVNVTGVVNSSSWLTWNGDWISFDETYFYTPNLAHWRWYDAEQTADPANTNGTDISVGDALEGEDTTPTSTRIVYNGNKVKLRVGINETAGTAGVDVRFRLQFSDDAGFVNVANVAEIGNVAVRWRYADGVDTDDTTIANRRISGTTASGTHNESGTTASTFDPAASTDTEFEFTIQDNIAAVNTTYYFRLYYTENSGGSGTPNGIVTNPAAAISLKTAAVYDLELSTAPTDVSLGDSNGNNDVSYDFTASEKIGFWDKRGTGVAYSVTTSILILKNGGNTIPSTDITWTSTVADPPDETKMLKGAFASDRTGTTTISPYTMAIPHNAYSAGSSTDQKRQGGFFFQPNITVTNLIGKATGNYVSTPALTLTAV